MGQDDPQTWAATERLVRMLRTHGEYKEAEALCAKVLERKIKTEAEPSSIARTQRQLGGILDDLGMTSRPLLPYDVSLLPYDMSLLT